MPECFYEHLWNRTLAIHELDPDYPTIYVLIGESQYFINSTDELGGDCYPIGHKNNTENINCYNHYNKGYNGLLKSKPMWAVPQLFDWSVSTKEVIKALPPTLQKMKCMIWQALVSEAKGLLFYSIMEIYQMDKITPFETRWKDVIDLIVQILEYKDMILFIEKYIKLNIQRIII